MKYSKVKAYKYKLEASEIRQTGITGYNFDNRYYSMLDDGTLLGKYGYTWDGSSVPWKRLLRIVSIGIYNADRYCKTASLIHDILYQAMRERQLSKDCKEKADALYGQMCAEGRKAKTKRLTAKKIKKIDEWAQRRYWALRKFGDVGIRPESKPRNKIYDTSEGE